MEEEQTPAPKPATAPVTAPGEMYQREQTEFPHTEVEGPSEVPILNHLRPGFWD